MISISRPHYSGQLSTRSEKGSAALLLDIIKISCLQGFALLSDYNAKLILVGIIALLINANDSTFFSLTKVFFITAAALQSVSRKSGQTNISVFLIKFGWAGMFRLMFLSNISQLNNQTRLIQSPIRHIRTENLMQ